MKTISLIDQIRASRGMYEKGISRLGEHTTNSLLIILNTINEVALKQLLDDADGDTLGRIMAASDDRLLARVLNYISDDSLSLALENVGDWSLIRLLNFCDGRLVDRILAVGGLKTVERVLILADDAVLARINIQVPIVENLDQRMLEVAETELFDMLSWHCGTTHCRAGWAIKFAGPEGAKLEDLVGSEIAGRLIYEASTGRIAPDFYASTEEAVDDIRRCAGVA